MRIRIVAVGKTLFGQRFLYVAIVTLALVASNLRAQPNFSDWAVPANLGALVNSSFNDAGPAISKDGLSLYFNSNRPAETTKGAGELTSRDENW